MLKDSFDSTPRFGIGVASVGYYMLSQTEMCIVRSLNGAIKIIVSMWTPGI